MSSQPRYPRPVGAHVPAQGQRDSLCAKRAALTGPTGTLHFVL